MMRTNLAAAAITAGLLAVGTPAMAAVYSFTFEGVVASGFDTGLFGVTGDLTGLRYTAAYTVDTETPGSSLTPVVPGFSTLIGDGAANPVTAALTINGVTRLLGGAPGAIIEMDQPSGFFADSLIAETGANETVCGEPGQDCVVWRGRLSHRTWSLLSDLVDGDVTTAPHTHVYGPDDIVTASFEDYRMVTPTTFEDRTSAIFTVERVTVGGAVVPEPATWALLILGFGVAGGALRRQWASARMSFRGR